MASGRAPEALLIAALLTIASAAHARDGNTLKDELRIFSEDIATQCTAVQGQLKNFNVRADPLTAYTLKDAVQSLCVCLPAKTQDLTSALSPEDLARAVTAEEFLVLFNPAVIDKCAAEQMHAMYGEECPRRFKKAKINAHLYCPCMKEVVSGYSDATSAAIAAAASDYLPDAAEAEKSGKPVPQRPQVLEDYYQADHACKSKKP